MTLNISGATQGVDLVGMQKLITDVNVQCIQPTKASLRSSANTLRETINTVWVGASANAFKDKITRDTELVCNTLDELEASIQNDMKHAGTNVEEYDAALAAALFAGTDAANRAAMGGGGSTPGSSTPSSGVTPPSNTSDTAEKNPGIVTNPTPAPTPTNTPINEDDVSRIEKDLTDPTPTPTAAPETPTPTGTPAPTATPEPTPTATPEPTPTATPEPTPTATPEPTPTATPEPVPTVTPEPVPTVTPETPVSTDPVAKDTPAPTPAETPTETPTTETPVQPTPSGAVTTPSGNTANSNPDKGFNVTTNNRQVTLSEDDFNLMATIVQKEAGPNSYDDKLAVASVILNRTEDPAWIHDFGDTVRGQVAHHSQFSTYTEGMTYNSSTYDEQTRQAVMDALNGIRNNQYLSFRSNGTESYGDNMISSNGNRYQ